MRLGVNGDQTDNSAPKAGAVYVFTRDRGGLDAAGLSQSLKCRAACSDTLLHSRATRSLWELRLKPVMRRASMAIRSNECADTPEPSMCSRGPLGSGLSRPISKPRIPMLGTDLGRASALDGDTLVVGARFEASTATGINGDQTDNSAPNAGAVYVFTRTAGVWTQQAYLKASNAGANQNFGGTLAIAGDLLAVGARLEDSDATGINGDQGNSNAPDSGAVYVFATSGGVWTQKAYLKASNTNAGDQFGDAVALSGSSLAVGAWFEAKQRRSKERGRLCIRRAVKLSANDFILGIGGPLLISWWLMTAF